MVKSREAVNKKVAVNRKTANSTLGSWLLSIQSIMKLSLLNVTLQF
ncbi:hypothetical protein HMPREF9372_2952 [Sporosarcina newyorkensis 2681]|uniref:Uncharacterized protein n=1 Tax=Sporosarcina newyorkensis 2681 TaxID=1027292 RepID=F9DVX1_9BACL|nr:hypothetical protein HMPREF9372_2952 [Sporosarcina newyorkensis 2681]